MTWFFNLRSRLTSSHKSGHGDENDSTGMSTSFINYPPFSLPLDSSIDIIHWFQVKQNINIQAAQPQTQPPPQHSTPSPSYFPEQQHQQSPPTPQRPLIHPIPESIIAATEKGMICENLMCSTLPSPALHKQYQNQPLPPYQLPQEETQLAPLSSTNSAEQPKHETEPDSPALVMRPSEAAGREGKRGSWATGSGRCVRWKGTDA